jgi:hypothetical protein
MEGELENQDDLIVLLGNFGEYDKFGWQAVPDIGPVTIISTYPYDTDGQLKGVIDFQTEFDWQTRHWQYYNEFSDRKYDFVNFRDKQTSLDCPRLHNISVAKHEECVRLLNAITVDLAEPQINWEGNSVSHFESSSTAAYEFCLKEHVIALQNYENCVRDATPDYDALSAW